MKHGASIGETMNLEEYNQYISALCDYIECYNAMLAQFHCYPMDAYDLDKERCFV